MLTTVETSKFTNYTYRYRSSPSNSFNHSIKTHTFALQRCKDELSKRTERKSSVSSIYPQPPLSFPHSRHKAPLPQTHLPNQPTEQTPTMLSLKALALFLSACAFAAPAPAPAPAAAPAEVTPEDRAGSPDDPTWYCQWRNRVLWDEYTLEGHRWGSAGAEDALRGMIGSHGGWITGWRYEADEDGGFRAKVRLPFPFPFPLPSFFFLLFSRSKANLSPFRLKVELAAPHGPQRRGQPRQAARSA
jgi:hypothetical protein